MKSKKVRAVPMWESPAQPLPTVGQWAVAEGMSKKALMKHFCSDGVRSSGMACVACPAQCAFGREYLKEGVPEVDQKSAQYPEKAFGRAVPVIKMDGKGNVIERYPSMTAAVKSMGKSHVTQLRRSITNGWYYGGFFWRYDV